jgi:hypothetical protein
MTGDEIVKFLNEQWDRIESGDWHERDCQMLKPVPAGAPPILQGTFSCNCTVQDYVLADIAAKRKILAHWVEADEDATADSTDIAAQMTRAVLSITLKALASPFAGQLGYRQEWAA